MNVTKDKTASFVAQEALYQNALLSALFQRSDVLPGVAMPYEQGLSAYRNNGSLNASRALSLMFPSIYAVLGEDDFYPLARMYWLAQPPVYGDWSQYGAGFSAWIAQHNPGGVLDGLPYLPDLAQLDDSLSRSQDAKDVKDVKDANGAGFDLSTLALLANDPAKLRVVLHPSVAVLDLGYDVVSHHQLVLDQVKNQAESIEHSPNTAGAKPLARLEPTLKTSHAIVARQDWRAVATPVQADCAAFVRLCRAGATVLSACDAAIAVNAQFDAAQWLLQAIPAQWLLRVETA